MPVKYDPYADPTFINNFIFDFCTENNEKIDFLQTVLGYCLSGEISGQCGFIFCGRGTNGKSALIELLKEIFGDFFDTASKDVWLTGSNRNSGGPSPHIADLVNKRISVCDEIPPKSAIDEGQFKLITGSSHFKARQLYDSFVTYINYVKPVLFCNPPLPQASTAFSLWRRIIVFVCETTYVNHPSQIKDTKTYKLSDPTINIKLKNPVNLSAFLNWLIIGAVRFYQQGLKAPQCIMDAVNAYKDDNDPIKEFFDIYYEQTNNSSDRVSKPETYNNYTSWFNNNADANEKLLSRKEFIAEFTKKAIRIMKSNGNEFYTGIKAKIVTQTNNQISTSEFLSI